MKMTTRLSFYLFISMLFFQTSCREVIDLGPSQLTPQLVIDGQISNKLKQHEVILSLSGDFGPDATYLPISNANVSISDGIQEFRLTESVEGKYLTDSIQGVPGRTYRLKVEWEGKEYLASDKMEPVPPEFDPQAFLLDDDHYEFEYRRHQFGAQKPFMWQLYIYPTNLPPNEPIDISNWGLQTGVEVFPPANYQFTYFSHPHIEVNGLMNFEEGHFYGFLPGHKVIQTRYALSDGYYYYLRSIFMETEWRETIFTSKSANVEGNISGGLGYFSAVSGREIVFSLE